MSEQREELLARYLSRLLAEDPKSVLDFGSGDGAILRRLAEAKVPAVGMEADPEALEHLRNLGWVVFESGSGSWPFADSSFDWVSLRHVLHHLLEPEFALSEALRVAAKGVLVAEPYFDIDLAGQELSRAAEAWSRRVENADGRIHRMGLEASEILDGCKSGSGEWDFGVELDLPVRDRDLPGFMAPYFELALGCENSAQLCAQGHDLLDQSRNERATLPGSTLVMARKQY